MLRLVLVLLQATQLLYSGGKHSGLRFGNIKIALTKQTRLSLERAWNGACFELLPKTM